MNDDDSFLTPAELAALLKVPVATLYAWRHKGCGPTAVPVGRHLRYPRSDLEKWLAGLKHE